MGEDYSNVFRPKPDCAFGNLVLSMLSHFISAENPKFHKDVFLYGRDKFIQPIQTVDIDEVPVGNATINSEDMKILHLKYLNTTEVMNIMIRPTEYLKEHIDKYYEQVKDCVAGFHCRRGLSCEDSAQFGYFPFADIKAVDAMIHEALRLDAPVYFLSDSVSTKEYIKSRVPKAVCLDFKIGFTADEHSQFCEVEDESLDAKLNSFVEWFLLSKMPRVYMTNGGINKRNVVQFVEEGLTSTYGYSAALYGGKIPYYVFNDGYIFQPVAEDTIERHGLRYNWSDILTRKFISYSLWGDNKVYTYGMIENVILARKYFPMWIVRIHYNETVPEEIIKWLAEQPNVYLVKHRGAEKRAANTLWRYNDLFIGIDDDHGSTVIFRDCDSRLSEREKILVDEWLKSNKDCHIIRDHPGHTCPILAGTFGSRNKLLKYLPNNLNQQDINKPPCEFVEGKHVFINYLTNITPETDNYIVDQRFLAFLYPLIVCRAFVHCSDNKYEPFAKDIEKVEIGFVGEVIYTAPNAAKIFGEDENTEFVREYQTQAL